MQKNKGKSRNIKIEGEKKRNKRGEKKREDSATPLRDHVIHDYLARFVSQNLESSLSFKSMCI
jgi:hypothetical protein